MKLYNPFLVSLSGFSFLSIVEYLGTYSKATLLLSLSQINLNYILEFANVLNILSGCLLQYSSVYFYKPLTFFIAIVQCDINAYTFA